MNKGKLVPLVGIIVLVLVTALGGGKSRAPAASPALPVVTSETQPMSVDELHARFKRALDASVPGHYLLDVDKDAFTFTLDEWAAGLNASFVSRSLTGRESYNKWNADTAAMADLCSDLHRQLAQHGHPEYRMICRLVNCDDFSQVFAVVENGVLVYDVVAETPPGSQIPEPQRASDYGSYIINLSSEVFHLSDCPSVELLSSSNRAVFTGSRDELLSQGFTPCRNCHP